MKKFTHIIFPSTKKRTLIEWVSSSIFLIFFLVLILFAYGLPLSGHLIWGVTDFLVHVLEIEQGDVLRVFGYYVGIQFFTALCVHAIFAMLMSWLAINVFLGYFFFFQTKKDKSILALKYLILYGIMLIGVVVVIFISRLK